MYSFADEALNPLRALPQALADLIRKLDDMAPTHPQRAGLVLMIDRLRDEIALREARAQAVPSPA